MPALTPFVGTLRLVINSPDEVEATVTADRLRELCLGYLDEEDGDQVILTQLTSNSSDLSPEESLVVLKRARNALIRTRIKECYDTARLLDQTIHALGMRQSIEESRVSYDYTALLDIAEQILNNGQDPI